MKVLLLSHIYPFSREMTRGPYIHNTFSALARRCEARMILPLPCWSRLRYPGELVRTPCETQTGIETYLPTFWSAPRMQGLHGRALYASLRPFVARLRREFAFDAIVAAWAYPDAVAASYLARDYGCPLVVRTLGSDINELPRDPGLARQIRQGLQRAQRVVAVSHALRERIVELGIAPERVIVQHNGVNGEKFFLRERDDMRQRLNIPVEKSALCYVGRLGHEKGVDVLIEAMGRIAASGRQDIDLHLVGGGSQEEALKARVQELHLEKQVHFHGMRPHDEIPLWISASDVFCLPSRREGCPNVVLEALASGRPVVASQVGGVPELIRSGENGILVPPDDPQTLSQALLQSLAATWQPQALRDSVEYLSWDAVGAMYYNTLRAILDEWDPAAAAGEESRGAAVAAAAVAGVQNARSSAYH